MRNFYFNGSCSNCKKKKVPVRKIGSVQCCGNCISKFKEVTNILKARD